MTDQPQPRPGILAIKAYVGGQAVLASRRAAIKLSSNESPLGASPRAMAAYREAGASLHRYPDGGAADLRAAIGARYGLDPALIVCGCGSDELINLLCHAYAGPGDEVIHTQYGFLMYGIAARSGGADPVAAPETGFRADVDAILATVSERTRIVFLANPNNPTGTYLAASEVARLRRGLPGTVLLVLDAAYAEYLGAADYEAGTGLVESRADTVMLRTFSKIHGLSALRLGWAYCPPAVADVLNRVRGPFNVSAPAQAAGIAALEDGDHAALARAHNDRWLPWLLGRLSGCGIAVTPSVGNFALARFPVGDARRGADAADRFLRERGYIVRDMKGYGLPEALRITVGLEADVLAVADAMAEFMAG